MPDQLECAIGVKLLLMMWGGRVCRVHCFPGTGLKDYSHVPVVTAPVGYRKASCKIIQNIQGVLFETYSERKISV